MTNRFAAATVAAMLLSGAAYAQTSTTNPPSNPAPANPALMAPANPSTANPSTTTTTMPSTTAPSSATTATRADGWLGTQVWKQGVFDPQNTRIGEIDDLVISTSGQITHALIGVGGFLGIGEKTVSVPFSSLKPMNRDGRIWFELSQTKEQLNAAPAFNTSAYKR